MLHLCTCTPSRARQPSCLAMRWETCLLFGTHNVRLRLLCLHCTMSSPVVACVALGPELEIELSPSVSFLLSSTCQAPCRLPCKLKMHHSSAGLWTVRETGQSVQLVRVHPTIWMWDCISECHSGSLNSPTSICNLGRLPRAEKAWVQIRGRATGASHNLKRC